MKKPTLRCSEPLARQTWRPKAFELMFPSVLRRTITNATWAEIRTAYASGISLREIARNMGIPEGTVLARAKRESWSREIQNAQVLVKREDAVPAVTATEAIAIAVQQRRERHLERMAGSRSVALITSKQWKVTKYSTPSILTDPTALSGESLGWVTAFPQPEKTLAAFISGDCCLSHPKVKCFALERPSNVSHSILSPSLAESLQDIPGGMALTL